MQIQTPKIKVGILEKGDQVLNVWQSDKIYYIAIKKNNQEVIVYSVSLDEDGLPRINRTPEITIVEGIGIVEAIGTTEDGQNILSITA